MKPTEYDFIVVGAGPSGCTVASRLAKSQSRPSVLLLEAGDSNNEGEFRVARERFTFWTTKGLKLDYGYKTEPQAGLNGRVIPYHRGKGLGGSSATNLGVWDYGSQPEYDEWARLVGDDVWKWRNVSACIKTIENYHNLTPVHAQDYVRVEPSSNGTKGPVDVTITEKWDPTVKVMLEAIRSYGLPLNPDVNGEDCIGFGVPPGTVNGGLRVTAASAFLSDIPENLNVEVHSRVERVLFDAGKAVGVAVSGGKKYYALKETVLCAGSIDTPKILMLSGIGPVDHLDQLGIDVVLDQPAIGANLMDHPMVRLAASVKKDMFDLGIQKLTSEVIDDGNDITSTCSGYARLEVTEYPEFKSLPLEKRNHLSNPKSSSYELVMRMMPDRSNKDRLLWNASIVMMNCMSTGRIFLKSKDPETPPGIDLNFLSHPYDVRAATDAVRKTAELLKYSTIPTDSLAVGPNSLQEEDIQSFLRENMGHLWHAVGTTKMGRKDDKHAAVSTDFRVIGVDGLRVADLSVAPIIPCNHTQSTAYLTGEIAATKMIEEYQLNQL